MAWYTIWKLAEMSAWLATMAARVARMNIGQKVPWGSDLKYVWLTFSGWCKR
jgi:hypothetical protein